MVKGLSEDAWSSSSCCDLIRLGETLVIAVQSPWMESALVLASIAFYVALGWIILQGYRWLRRGADASRLRAFEGLKIHSGPAPGLVAVVFHTYFGFIVFVIQTENRFWAPPYDARERYGDSIDST